MCFWIFVSLVCVFFFFKQKTAYEMRISDWSSDVCSSDLLVVGATDSNNNRASFSSYGNFLDVVAPGVGIKMATRGGGYGSGSGTSFSKIGRASCRERVCQYV